MSSRPAPSAAVSGKGRPLVAPERARLGPVTRLGVTFVVLLLVAIGLPPLPFAIGGNNPIQVTIVADPPGPTAPGSAVSYTVFVQNEGDEARTGVQVSVPVPDGTALVEGRTQVSLNPAVIAVVGDDFESGAFDGSAGLNPWAGPWTPEGDAGSARVFADDEAGSLVLSVGAPTTAVTRSVDLSGFPAAYLTYRYKRIDLPGTATFAVELSRAGDESFARIDELAGAGSGFTEPIYQTQTVDITSFISAATEIRFASDGVDLPDGAGFRLDQVTITSIPPAGSTGPHPGVASGFTLLPGDELTVDYSVVVNEELGEQAAFVAGVAVTSGEDQEPRSAEVVIELNQPPLAADDAIETAPGQPVTIDVLANDTDPNGEPLTGLEVGAPQNGTAVVNGDGTITYQPADGYLGQDTFSYSISDALGEAAGAAVTVTVTDSPVLPSTTTTIAAGPAPVMSAAAWRNSLPPEDPNLPLTFERNVGQADPALDYIARGQGYIVTLEGGDAVLSLGNGGSGHEVRMSFLGGVTDPQIITGDPLAGDGRPLYASVGYTDVYPGIDVSYAANDRELEYSFLVNPGADPASIALAFSGANSLAIDGSGALVVDRRGGRDLLATAPYAYQEVRGTQVPVAISYLLNDDGTVGFAVGTYYPELPLIIDPTFRSVASNSTNQTNNITIPAPAGIVVGDVLIAALGLRGVQAGIIVTTPGGWNLIREDIEVGEMSQHLYYKIATGSEPADYLFTYNQSREAAGAIAAYSGVDTTTPIDAHDGQYNAGSPPTAPSITTTVADTTLLAIFGIKGGGSIAPPSGMTERWDEPGTISIEGAEEVFAGPGVTGTRASTTSTSPTIGQLIALTPAPAGFVVNSTGDAADNDLLDGVCDTGGTNSQGGPECSLRAAIEQANALAGADTIEFNIPATEPGYSASPLRYTIQAGSLIEPLATTVIIDATTQPDYPGTPIIELDGSTLASLEDGLTVTGDNTEIRGFVINRFPGDGIGVDATAAGTLIAGNYVGTDVTGLVDLGNGRRGIDLVSGSGPTTIGGTAVADRNVISGNQSDGIVIWGSDGNTIVGNYIGTDATGNALLPNAIDGVRLGGGADNNIVGQAGTRNVISGNGNDGFEITDSSTGNMLHGNLIGLGADGTTIVANGRHGVVLYNGASGNTIGGTGAGEGNVISANVTNGVVIDGNGGAATTANLVHGNYIGTDSSGLLDRGNGGAGVYFFNGAHSNTVGGATAGHRNVISGNTTDGIYLQSAGTTDNVITGNYIGVDITGNAARPNGDRGVQIESGANNTIVGGTLAGEGNVISANDNDGIIISDGAIPGTGTTGTVIEGNLIGVGADGTTPLGNGTNGVRVTTEDGHRIGGTAAGAGNVIAHNVTRGVDIQNASATSNPILGNSLHTNGNIGIDLGDNGVTANDAGDGDSGANDLLNFPAITSATETGGTVKVDFDLDVANGNYRLEFFTNPGGADPSGNGEGEVFASSIDVTVAGGVPTPASTTFAGAAGDIITATATEGTAAPFGSTSEFSTAVTVVPGAFVVNSTGDAADAMPGDGMCDTNGFNSAGDPECTLRAAIEETNASAAASTIEFAIPDSEAGYQSLGAGLSYWRIQPTSALPIISGAGTSIDATTQTSYATGEGYNVNGSGPEVMIEGSLAGDVNGISITSGGNEILGLVISGFSRNFRSGVLIQTASADNNTVVGNYIGTDPYGTAANGNYYGIRVGAGADNTLIGGPSAADRNIVSGNADYGITLSSTGTVLLGNYVGIAADGAFALANADGISITGNGNTVGGTNPGDRNVISGNGLQNVFITGDTNTVIGNFIGPDASGTAALGGSRGVWINGGVSNVIGGSTPGERNVISGNGFRGVVLGNSATGNTVSGNYIGVDVTGTSPLANNGPGIELQFGVFSNTIGGVAGADGNVIANNLGHGILVSDAASIDNAILGNSTFDNNGLGIDLGDDGVTANDAGDADSGANDLLNFPVIASATEAGGIVTLFGTFDVPVGNYRFEFFISSAADPSGNGEGETFVGTAALAHTGSGDEPWGAVFPGSLGDVVTATLTECTDMTCTSFHSTSEFSPAVTVIVPNDPPVFDQDLGNQTDPEASWISLSSSATDPEGDTLTYSATGLPLGLTISSSTGLITGMVNFNAAAGSPYSVEVSVTDGTNPPVTDTFFWTITNVQATIPFVVAGTGGGNGGDDLLTKVEETSFDPVTNEVDVGIGTGTFSIEAIATDPTSGTLFAVDGGQFGSLNPDSGVFTPIGTGLGTADGTVGPVTLDDVRGLTFHPLNDRLYGVQRRAGGEDILFRIDPVTGTFIPNAFGADDYRRIKALGSLDDVTDIAVDPTDWEMYGVMTDGVTSELATIKRNSGNTKSVGSLTADLIGLDVTNAGQLWGTDAGALYTVDKTSGALDPGRLLDNGSSYGALAFGVNPAYPPSLEGVVFEDLDGNALGVAEAPDDLLNPGVSGVTVHLYRDLGTAGVPEGPGVDTWYASTTTGPTGRYFFSEIPVAPFWIVIDSSTIVPVAGGTGWAEQTYAPPGAVIDALFTVDPVAGPLFGGMRPTVSDDFSGTGLVGAEHIAYHSFTPAEVVEGIDFGFSFNVVTNLEGNGAVSEQGSLRQFILNANQGTGSNSMRFVPAVPTNATGGSGDWWSLALTAALPAGTDPATTIDGTAFDAADGVTIVNSNAGGPELELNGTGVVAIGLDITGGTSTVRDLIINRFATGVRLTGGDANTVAGNYIGPDASGLDGQVGNTTEGIRIEVSENNVIGGIATADRNVISGNRLRGIAIDDSSDGAPIRARGNQIIGNYIGTNANGLSSLPYDNTPDYQQIGVYLLQSVDGVIGTAADGNVISGNAWYGIYAWGPNGDNNTIQGNIIGLDFLAAGPVPNAFDTPPRAGILISNAPGNLVGGTGAGEGNIVSGNADAGIVVSAAGATGNAILGNAIWGNSALGIDLEGDGVTANDADDLDAGANNLLNFPVIASATALGSVGTVDFGLDVPAGDYRIEFYTNTAADPSTYGEGETFAGSYDVVGHPGGPATYRATVTAVDGDVLTATATGEIGAPFGPTSEFSQAFTVVAGTIVVNSTGDDSDISIGDGVCYTGNSNSESDPECTLRAALEETNALAGPDTVWFDIPTSDPGYTASPLAFTLNPASGFEAITGPLTLDATTQAGWAGDPIIQLDGTLAVGATAGLVVEGSDTTIAGFIIHSFPDEGLEIDGIPGTGDNNTLRNNWVGLDASGTVRGNTDNGILITDDAVGNLIGGTGPFDGNVIAGSGNRGINIRLNSIGNTVIGNSIHGNTQLGIDLDEDGVTENDLIPGDPDSGSNDLLNFPEITSATELAGALTVDFDLDVPAGDYRIEFFTNVAADLTGNGEGETFAGSFDVIAHPGTGPVSYSASFAGSAGDILTATTTEEVGAPFGSTSEFSDAFTVNRPPVLDPVGDRSVDELVLLSFTATASDPDVGDNLVFSLSGEPAGASIDPVSGVFSWTPSEAQGPGSYTFAVVVTDDGTPNLGGFESITVTVNEVNVAPVVTNPGDQTDAEGNVVSLAISASDADVPANGLGYGAVGLPPGLSIDPVSGVISGTVAFGCSAGSPYAVTVTVTDDGTPNLAGTAVFDWYCPDTNQPPTLDPVGDWSVDELVLLSFTATASDPDVGDTLTFSLSGEPFGASIDPNTGVFTWTPTEAQGPNSYTFDVIVTDDGVPVLSDSETITVTVNEVNVAPVLGAVGNQTTDEQTLLTFTATATDTDLPANTLTFSLSGEPAGAAIDPNTGVFTWTPTEAQGPNSYTFDVIVTDDGAGLLSDSETITVTVNEVNIAPVLGAVGDQAVNEQTLLTFTATATDADLPANTLTFSLSGEPASASIDPNTGVFTWTPTEAQGPNAYTFDVIVSDGTTPDSETITVTVNEVNVSPVLGAVGSQTTDEQTLLTFTATATDADLPANTLTFSLSGEPAGASIDPNTGVFTWTPTEAQGPNSYTFDVVVTDDGAGTLSDSETITVTVNEANVAPVLGAVGNQSTDELVLLTFTATATDADLPANTLTFSLSGEPAGASIDPNTGVFTWTPSEAQGPNAYTFDVVVSDNGVPVRSDSETITVTVNEVNIAPVLGAVGDQTVDEQTLLTFTATATDADLPANTLTFSLSGEPVGASIDPNTGVVTWTPSEAQGPNSYTFDVIVADDGVPAFSDSETITVTVNETNLAPVLDPIGNQTGDELTLITFTATATDADLPVNTLTFSLSGEPAGAAIDPNTGVFTWTPTETQGPNSYTFDVVVTDDGAGALSDSETITVTVNEANVAPVLGAVGNQTVDEQTLLTFTATATDSDLPANTLTFSLSGEPAGALIDPVSGVFTWTPSEAQGPNSYTFDVNVSDGVGGSDSETITVTVNEVNVAPVLNGIGNQTTNELVLLTFTASATDADLPANTLTFSLSGGPAGASIDPNTGVFTWIPTEAQGPNSYTFDVIVSDGTTPDSETITVTVDEVNVAPVVTNPGDQTDAEGTVVSLPITASDADLPANTLGYGAAGLPPGLSIDPVTGVISGTVAFGCNAGSPHAVTVTVTDDGTPNLAGNAVFDWYCPNTNRPPVLDPVGNQSGDELTLITFTATASDPDVGDTLTFSLSGEPAGASIDPNTGVFTWTPSETQGPGSYTFDVVVTDDGTPNLADSESITVTVNETNVAPVLAAIGNQTVDEQTLLTFTASATDSDLPANGLLFSLSGEPGGALIDPNSGVFTWTPTETQGPGSYTFDVVVTDDGTPNLADSESITVTVNETNVAPVLAAIGNQTVDEQTLLTFTASATDSDLPANGLLFSLVGEPGGALIDPNSGVFTWTPSEAQGPGSYTFDVVVTDNGTPNLADFEMITVTVGEVNVAPVVANPGDQTDAEGSVVSLAISASDADLPANGLGYGAVGLPPGLSIGPVSGVISGTVGFGCNAGSPHAVTVTVTDDGTPSLAGTAVFDWYCPNTNRPPVLDPVGNQSVDEQTLLALTATASDPDVGDSLLFSLVGAVPAGASITGGGDFAWTPTEGQGPGVYTFDVVVTDNGTPNLADFETITVTVGEVNVAPVLDPVGDQTIDELALLAFTATASDVDVPANTLTFSLSGEPAGAAITGGGDFAWTPTEGQGPGVYTFDVVVTDNGTPNLADFETITVTVGEVNVAPTLDPIGPQSVDEQTLLTFTATASDVDLPANGLTFSLSGEPAGAVIDPVTGVFTWTPSEAQGPGSYTFAVVVTDDGTPNLGDFESITVTVNEVNVAPVVTNPGDQTVDEGTALTFTATATDADVPANGLTFSLVGAPAGAAIDPVSGVFTWTPSEAQGPGVFTFDVVVTDDGTPNLNDSETISVTVNEVNVAPVLGAIGNQTVDEGTALTFTATATDADVPANGLTFSLVGAPAGAAIDPVSGVFSWTPSEAQGPGVFTFDVVVTDDGTPNLIDSETISVTVNEVNVAPVVTNPGDQTSAEGEAVSLFVAAADADVPANTLTWSAAGLPPGLSIDPGSGLISGTVAFGCNAGSPYAVTVTVTDDGISNLAGTAVFDWYCPDTNQPPTLDPIGPQSVDEQTLLSFTATASDPDVGDNLLFSLVGAPAGASIDPNSGVFTWTPTEAQGPGVFTFDVVVTDDGTPNLNDFESISVTVNEVNVAPVVTNPGDQTDAEGNMVSLAISASDADVPANALTWSATGLPDGLSIGPVSGTISGTISFDAAAASPHATTVTATDNGTPSLAGNVAFVWNVADLNRPPVAIDDSDTVAEDLVVTVDVLGNDSDPDLDGLAVSAVTQGADGTVVNNGTNVMYAPDLNWNGTDTFTYTVTDGRGGLDTASVTVVVTPVNDAPVAVDDAVTLNEDGSGLVSVLTNDFDVDGDLLNLVVYTNPTNGTLTHLGGGTFVYNPDPDFFGVDTFTYTAGDGTLNDGATVTLTVLAVNDAPVAVGDGYTMTGDTSLDTMIAGLAGVLANDTDVDGDPLTAMLETGPTNGALSLAPAGSFVYSPDPGWFGTDSFTYHADDGAAGSGPVMVQIVVDRPNQNPIAAGDQYTVDEGDTLVVGAPGVLGNDSDPDADLLAAVLATPPTRGTVTLASNGSFTYIHTATNAVDDSFTYLATDQWGGTALAVVIIQVRENLAPVVTADLLAIDEDTVGTLDVLANDFDPEGVSLTIAEIEQPANGVVTINADGTLSFSPAADWFGITGFAYLAGDGFKTSRGLVTVLVAGINDPPVGGRDSFRFVQYGPEVLDVLANDTDVDGDALAVVAVGSVEHALAEIVDGQLIYNAHSEWLGSETFTYTLSDGNGLTVEVDVTVTMAEEALDAANQLAGVVGAPGVPFQSPEASPDIGSISLASPKAISLLAGAFFDSFDALRLPLTFLLLALVWALVFGGLFSSPWFLFGARRRFWSIVLVDRESMVPVYAEPDSEGQTVYNYPPTTQNIRSTGVPNRKGKTVWMPIDTPNGEGWINAYYLTQEVDDDTFAKDKRPADLASKFVTALTAENVRAMQKLVSERGLATLRFGTPVVVPVHRLKALLSTEKEPGWWRSDALTAMEALFPERLAEPFLSSYWAGRQEAVSGKVATLLIPAEIRNFQRFTYSNADGTWWLLFEYRKNKLSIAGIALAE